MNLQQLRSLCQVAERGLKISEAADVLGRSQPSITRHVQDLEAELGLTIFERKRNRVLGVTPVGEQIIGAARVALQQVETIYRIRDDFTREDEGELTVATTHTQARYTLPQFVQKFRDEFPKVRLVLLQGSPVQCFSMVADGVADFAICTEMPGRLDQTIFIPCYWLTRSVVTPPDHPLLDVVPLTLEAMAKYEIITYGEEFSARKIVERAFLDRNLQPSFVMSAVDADVSKAYVELGLGIAILATVAFDAERDSMLRRIDAAHLFEHSRLGIVVRRNGYMRKFAFSFVHFFAPKLRRSLIEETLRRGSWDGATDGFPKL